MGTLKKIFFILLPICLLILLIENPEKKNFNEEYHILLSNISFGGNFNALLDYLTYILPIFTLLLGIIINNILAWLNNRKRIRRSGERWVAELESLEEPLLNQLDSIKYFVRNLDSSKPLVPDLIVFSILNGEIFKSLDKNNLIKFIESNNKLDFNESVKLSNKVHGYINILTQLHETLNERLINFRANISSHFISLKRNVQQFSNSHSVYNIFLKEKLGKNYKQDDRYQFISELYLKYMVPHLANENFNPYILEKKLFNPLVDFLISYIADENTKILLNPIRDCLENINALHEEDSHLLRELDKIIKKYEELIQQRPIIIKNIYNN